MIISLSPLVGNAECTMTRSLYKALNNRLPWFSQVMLTDEATQEIKFWKLNAHSLNS